MAGYISEVLIAFISIVFVSLAMKMGIGSLRDPGAGFWPLIICLVIIVLASLAGLQNVKLKIRANFDLRAMRKPILAISSITVYIFLLENLGYMLPTPLLVLFWLRVIGAESWRISIVLSILLAAFFYFVFSTLLGVPFPPDILLE